MMNRLKKLKKFFKKNKYIFVILFKTIGVLILVAIVIFLIAVILKYGLVWIIEQLAAFMKWLFTNLGIL